MRELITALNKELKKNKDVNDLQFDLNYGYTNISLNSEYTANRLWLKTELKISPGLAEILGLRNFNIDKINMNDIKHIPIENNIVDTIPSIAYIYCSAIDHSIVGDINAKLLRVLRIQYLPGLQKIANVINQSNYFNKINYYNVSTSYLDTISIKILDQSGQPFPLTSGSLILVLSLQEL